MECKFGCSCWRPLCPCTHGRVRRWVEPWSFFSSEEVREVQRVGMQRVRHFNLRVDAPGTGADEHSEHRGAWWSLEISEQRFLAGESPRPTLVGSEGRCRCDANKRAYHDESSMSVTEGVSRYEMPSKPAYSNLRTFTKKLRSDFGAGAPTDKLNPKRPSDEDTLHG